MSDLSSSGDTLSGNGARIELDPELEGSSITISPDLNGVAGFFLDNAYVCFVNELTVDLLAQAPSTAAALTIDTI